MSRARLDEKLAEMESLFAVERELVPEPDGVRNRVIRRARASLPRTLPVEFVKRSARPRRVRIGWAAAAVVMLSVSCVIAFHAGYQMKSRSSAAPAPAPIPTHSVVVLPVPVAPPATSPPTDPKPPLAEPRTAKTKPVGSAKSAADAYAMEVRVLQPAQRAVAREDFASALAAIAEHERRFPSGKLAEEREALRVKALLGLGRSEDAQRAGVAFGKRFPRSALVRRMDRMVSTQK
jgi:hypothetical protein